MILIEHEAYPYGWTTDLVVGHRGPWVEVGVRERMRDLMNLIYFLEKSQEPNLHDPVGNEYCCVDRYVIKQALESLRRYERLLKQPLGQLVADSWPDTYGGP